MGIFAKHASRGDTWERRVVGTLVSHPQRTGGPGAKGLRENAGGTPAFPGTYRASAAACEGGRAGRRPEGAPETRSGRVRDLPGPRQETILVTMTTASVSDLKANLSRYLRVVRRGGEVQVLDRGTPVARLAPPAAKDDEGVRERLIARGILRPGEGSAAAILDKPPLALPVSLSEALAEERTERL